MPAEAPVVALVELERGDEELEFLVEPLSEPGVELVAQCHRQPLRRVDENGAVRHRQERPYPLRASVIRVSGNPPLHDIGQIRSSSALEVVEKLFERRRSRSRREGSVVALASLCELASLSVVTRRPPMLSCLKTVVSGEQCHQPT